jgi:5-methyltetrahydropteroyltriglutamate--homocysteine methyltransferase
MKRSQDRILTTHGGSLPRPADVAALVTAKERGGSTDASYSQIVADATSRVVRQQLDAGINVINDGEIAKSSWHDYTVNRVTGIEIRPRSEDLRRLRREGAAFPEFFRDNPGQEVIREQFVCVGPIKYVGHAAVQADIAALKAAADGVSFEDLFMTAMTPAALGVDATFEVDGHREHTLENKYYASTEEMMFALGEALREEYEAITQAGLVLQLDDPALCKIWTANPDYDLATYMREAEQTVEALNHALRNIPREQVRQHICWGAGTGPHTDDIPLRTVADLILKVNCGAYGVEGANPRHEHEWKVWKDVKLPDGAILIPGVVTGKTNIIEHPELVADRIVRYAEIVGRENMIAGTDCGLADGRIHPELAWAKLQVLAEGAQLASRQLGMSGG